MRIWVGARLAKEFGVLPRVALDDLESDPEQLSLAALLLLHYAEAWSAFKHAKDKVADMPEWKGSEAMRVVEKNWFALARERNARWAKVREGQRKEGVS